MKLEEPDKTKVGLDSTASELKKSEPVA